MSQGFNPTRPSYKSSLLSVEMRTNFVALASQNKGSTPPSNICEGMFWLYDGHPTRWELRQRMSGVWRVILKYDLSTDKVGITSGELMAKEDYKVCEDSDIIGPKNGSNVTFTLPDTQSYFFGTLAVFINGQQYNPANILQNGPGYTTFTIINGDHIPILTDILSLTYLLA